MQNHGLAQCMLPIGPEFNLGLPAGQLQDMPQEQVVCEAWPQARAL